MKILWFTWKDLKNPLSGGAEVVNEELAKRLVADGHEVTFIVGGFKGGKTEEIIDEYKIIRVGGRHTVYWHTYKYYKKNFRGWADIVIDEINTVPFFAKFYVKEKNILFVHQLSREIWFYQMFFPLNWIGYLLEPLYLRLIASRFRLSTLWTLKTFDSPQVITVSESTKKDLIKYGFKDNNISIISEGIKLIPIEKLENIKYKIPTILSLGAIRAMKRTDHIIKAFEIAKINIPELELIIAGDHSDKFGKKVYRMAKNSKFKNSIKILGRVSDEKRIELMQKSHLICVTSVKEGWGLIVTEANSQGTPAVVYNVDGLRDSVKHNETGIICTENTPTNLAQNIEKTLKNKDEYANMRFQAWNWSKEITFNRSYEEFKKILNI